MYKSSFSHLFLYSWVRADIEEDVETDKEEFILFPNQYIEFFELRSGSDSVIFIISSPHFDILAIEEVKTLNLILQNFNNSEADLILSKQLLELLIVAENIEDTEDVD